MELFSHSVNGRCHLLDLHPCLFEIFKMSEIDTPRKGRLYRQETHLELNIVAEDVVMEKNNLIGLTGNLETLGSLCTSLVSRRRVSLYAAVWTLSTSQNWFTDALDILKAVPETLLSPTTPLKLTPMSAVIPYTAGVPFLRPLDPSEPLQLPLLKETSM